MRLFTGFGAWINQTLNVSFIALNAESKRSDHENVVSENDTSTKEKEVYYDEAEVTKQSELWYDAEKKEPWYDAPPKVKVTKKNGLYHMKIEFTIGSAPDAVYDLLTNEAPLMDYKKFQPLMENKSVQVLKEDGPRKVTKVKKAVAWKVLWLSIPIPIYLTVEENRKDLTTKYKKDKVMFLKEFEGNYKVEPLFIDSERLCKHKVPKNREEYKICSGGQGKIASKVTLNQYVKPCSLLDMPPFSWYISFIAIKTTKSAIKAVQNRSVFIRKADPNVLNGKTSNNRHEKNTSVK